MDQQQAPTPSRPPRVWLPIAFASATILSGVGVVSQRVVSLGDRIELAEQIHARQSGDVRDHLEGVQSELAGIREEIGAAFTNMEGSQELGHRLQSAEEHLSAIGAAIEAHTSSLEQLEETQASFAPGIERELRERDERMQERYEALSEVAEGARAAAESSQQGMSKLQQELSAPPDLEKMWRELVGPVVQLAGDSSVGSGVLLISESRPEGDYSTHLLTAWHVVRDIQGDPPDLEMPVPVRIYHEDGTTREETARLLVHDPKLDAALLELVTPDRLDFGARLAPRSHLESMQIFDPIVAVGCPLGNDPIPTCGEIATCRHEVDGEHYWMINAPTYIGNSGGGIFDAKTHDLLALFSKIYTHGSLRPTIIPHMGLVTPLTRVYDWLDQVGYGRIVPREFDEARIGEAAASGR